MPPPAALESEVRQAIDDLVERTGADPERIRVETAERVTWRSGALGCPEPGMMYTQALVPGYRIVLVVDGEPHHYHGARDEPPFACPSERVERPLPAEADDVGDPR